MNDQSCVVYGIRFYEMEIFAIFNSFLDKKELSNISRTLFDIARGIDEGKEEEKEEKKETFSLSHIIDYVNSKNIKEGIGENEEEKRIFFVKSQGRKRENIYILGTAFQADMFNNIIDITQKLEENYVLKKLGVPKSEYSLIYTQSFEKEGCGVVEIGSSERELF